MNRQRLVLLFSLMLLCSLAACGAEQRRVTPAEEARAVRVLCATHRAYGQSDPILDAVCDDLPALASEGGAGGSEP